MKQPEKLSEVYPSHVTRGYTANLFGTLISPLEEIRLATSSGVIESRLQDGESRIPRFLRPKPAPVRRTSLRLHLSNLSFHSQISLLMKPLLVRFQ